MREVVVRKIVREKIYSHRISILNAGMAEKRLKEWAEQCEKLHGSIKTTLIAIAKNCDANKCTKANLDWLMSQIIKYEEWLLNEKD